MVVFAVVRVVVVEAVVGDKARSPNGGSGVLVLTWMQLRILARRKVPSLSVAAAWGKY